MKEYRSLGSLQNYLIKMKDSVLKGSSGDTKYVVGSFAYDKRGLLISRGLNSFTKTHPFQKKMADIAGRDVSSERQHEYRIYLHAEISALVRAKKPVETLIVARIRHSDHSLALARPCPVCIEAIKQAGVKKVYFTNDSGELVLLDVR